MKKYHDRMVALLALAAIAAVVVGSLMTIDALRTETRLEVARAQARYEDAQAEADKLAARELLPEGMEAEYIGEFLCTSYDKNCPVCGTTDICYSGEPFVAGVSCALNKSMLENFPMGTWLYIEGVGIRKVSDIGGGVNQNQIDIAVAGTHEEAFHWSGYGFHDVWVISFEKT